MGAVIWTLLLVGAMGGWRVVQVLGRWQAPNAFPSGQPHGPSWYQRLNRAHMNCVENVPLYGLVVIAADQLVVIPGDTVGWLAWAWFLARIGQTLAHVSSGSNLAVNVRFTFFAVQQVCLGWMIWLVLQRFA